jgi:hypothetical protein
VLIGLPPNKYGFQTYPRKLLIRLQLTLILITLNPTHILPPLRNTTLHNLLEQCLLNEPHGLFTRVSLDDIPHELHDKQLGLRRAGHAEAVLAK